MCCYGAVHPSRYYLFQIPPDHSVKEMANSEDILVRHHTAATEITRPRVFAIYLSLFF